MNLLNWGSLADWAQVVSSTIVLWLIFMQIRQVNLQMLQNDEQERYRHSWEFVTFCRDELRQYEREIFDQLERYFEVLKAPESSDFQLLYRHFYKPRVHIFGLLNQLIQHQAVDERVLYGYLGDEFNCFVELGVASMGHQSFTREVGPKIDLLLTLWGSNPRLKTILFGNKSAIAASTDPASPGTSSQQV